MQMPSKKILYVLIACIISISVIYITKRYTTPPKQISLETSADKQAYEDQADIYSDQNIPIDSPLENQNLTQSFAKSFFIKYMANNENDLLDDESNQNLIDQAVESYGGLKLTNDNHYSFQDLKITSGSKEDIRSFANSFAAKQESCMTKTKELAEKSRDGETTGEMFKKCADEFAKIGIPEAMNMDYLDLLNIHYSMGEKLILIQNSLNDPLKILILIKDINELNTLKEKTYLRIFNFIKSSGIIFSESEPGKVWVVKTQ